MFSNLLSTMFKLLNALNLKFEDIFGTAGSSIEHITVGGTVEELYEEVKWRFGQVCHYVRNQRGDSSSLLLEKIQRYITDHHDDTMISLASIAEQFNITPPYLSAFFKKNSGTNLTDYLAKIRIEHAKEMMRDARNTISHIARSVGYTSDVGFIRVFKKYEASRRANIRNFAFSIIDLKKRSSSFLIPVHESRMCMIYGKCTLSLEFESGTSRTVPMESVHLSH